MRGAAGGLLALLLAGCDAPWQKLQTYPVGERPMPRVVSETPGTGPRVMPGALVEVDLEILEPSSVFVKESVKGARRRAWVWTGAAVMKGGELGSESARRLLAQRNVGAVLTVDAKTRTYEGSGPPNYGSVWVLDRPFADHKASIIVHDTVYRMRILRACPAEAWERRAGHTTFGFESGCKGDFLPTSCGPSLWRTDRYHRYRITASCGGEKLEFTNRLPGDPPAN